MDPKKLPEGIRSSSGLDFVPALIGLLIGLLAVTVEPFTGKVYQFIIGSLVFFLCGISGLIVFVRREIWQFVLPIKGKLAMIYGIFMMTIS
jgi:hypothetical protein